MAASSSSFIPTPRAPADNLGRRAPLQQERGPTAVLAPKFFAKKRQIEGFKKGVNDEKLLGSACVSGDEMGVSQR
ncbi:hypothetical protein TNCV_1272981 [Trichonephila clavipes]|nr:hypothetical protein TNCV_1272981 [Trichonephila clavipes]